MSSVDCRNPSIFDSSSRVGSKGSRTGRPEASREAPGRNVLVHEGEATDLPSTETATLKRDDVISIGMAGGMGRPKVSPRIYPKGMPGEERT